jgi:drug/metabolite transporter (DMT)-like permease
MTTLTHDAAASPASAARRRTTAGLGFAIVSAVTFALSGPLGRAQLDAGWTPGSVVLVRLGIAALLVAPLGAWSLSGRWALLRRHWRVVVLYGALGGAGAQFCYFSAIQHMAVGPALLIEYTAPAAVVVWLWVRHGERPGLLTVAGAGVAVLGLVLVLDLASGADLSLVGVLWSLAAMVGAAAYFLISADESTGLPPLALAGGGLLSGTLLLGLLGLVGLLPLSSATADVELAGRAVAWWLPLLLLGVVTAAVAYTTGIAAGRRLGSRLASFVALLEVVAAIGFAWLLLDQLPAPVQLVGGLLVLAGVVAVKLGERRVAAATVPG